LALQRFDPQSCAHWEERKEQKMIMDLPSSQDSSQSLSSQELPSPEGDSQQDTQPFISVTQQTNARRKRKLVYLSMMEMDIQNHDFRHRATCFDSAKRIRRNNDPPPTCRFSFPRPLQLGTYINLELMTIDLKRRSGSAWLNPFIEAALRAFKSNVDARCLIGAEPGVIFYTACYPAKDQQKKQVVDAVLNAAFSKRVLFEQQRQQWTEVSDASVGRGRVLSSLFHLTATDATGLPLASYYLLNGGEAFRFSHSFVPIHIPQVQAFLLGQQLTETLFIEQSNSARIKRATPLIYDYIYRGEELSDWPLYLFVALYSKRKKNGQTAPSSPHSTTLDDPTEGISENSEEVGSRFSDYLQRYLFSLHFSTPSNNATLLKSMISFQVDHPQASTHELFLQKHALIPQLNGRRLFDSSIMSNDNNGNSNNSTNNNRTTEMTLLQKRGYFARFALGLFVPFRKSSDLFLLPGNPLDENVESMDDDSKWYLAYDNHQRTKLEMHVIGNLDQYYKGKETARLRALQASSNPQIGRNEVVQGIQDEGADFEGINNISGNTQENNLDALANIAVLEAENPNPRNTPIGMFTSSYVPPQLEFISNPITLFEDKDEDKQRSKAWEQLIQNAHSIHLSLPSSEIIVDDFPTRLSIIDDSTRLTPRVARFLNLIHVLESSVQLQRTNSSSLPPVEFSPHEPDLQSIIFHFTLNLEQKAAFIILATHLLIHEFKLISLSFVQNDISIQRGISAIQQIQNNEDTLYMVLHGPAGTGKSRVISALKCFAEGWSISHKLLITATTGAAAVLLGGSTYHSALGFSKFSSGKISNERYQHMSKVTLLIIDEMSMLGVKGFLQIEKQLRRITNRSEKSFGGVSICLVGDFFQLKPVLDSPLYSLTGQGQVQLGLELYRRYFKCAIMLRQNMRQQNDPAYATVLSSFRHPPVPLKVLSTLNARNIPIPSSLFEWAPMAVRSNDLRVAIIRDHVEEACRRRCNNLTLYPIVFGFEASYRFSQKKNIDRTTINGWIRFLSTCIDSDLEGLSPTFYCYIGMHVMVTQTIAIAHGVANGTLGIVIGYVWNELQDSRQGRQKSFRNEMEGPKYFVPNENPKFILIKLLGESSRVLRNSVKFRGLTEDIYPIGAVTMPVSKRLPNREKCISARMTQFPLVCADAITIHKLQGATLTSNLYVHSLVGAGLQAAYTVLTRVKKLDQIFFIEELKKEMVQQWKLPLGLEIEVHRLEVISNRLEGISNQCFHEHE